MGGKQLNSGGSFQGGAGFARGASQLVGDPVAQAASPFWFGNTNRPLTIDDIVNGPNSNRLPPPTIAAANSTQNPGVIYGTGVGNNQPRNYLLEALKIPQASESVWVPGQNNRTSIQRPDLQLSKNSGPNEFLRQGYSDNQGNLYNKSGVKRANVKF
jgi:hypothetical protein